MNKRVLALGRLKSGEMNKTEEEFAQYLEAIKRLGQIHEYLFEPITLRLAKRTSYTPDFYVVQPDGEQIFYEVKGYFMDDAKVKVKVAREKFPFFRFVIVRKKAKKDGGGWDFEEV